MLKRVLIIILAVLLLFCLFVSCILPCVRQMIIKMVNVNVVYAYEALAMNDREIGNQDAEEEEDSV